MVAKRNVLKSQLPLIIVAATAVLLAIIYFFHPRSKCESIFEQTADRLGGNLEFINIKGGLVLGREKVQELTEGSQKVALHLKTCCIAQQAGSINADQFQFCISGAKDYETKIIQVATNIKEAKAAEEQQKPDLARQKTEQARAAANEAINTEKTLAKTTESLAATATPKSTLQQPSTAMSAVEFEKSSMPAIVVEKFDGPPDALDEFHVVKAGTNLRGMYQVKYQPKPGSTVVVEPGTYDVVARTKGGGTYLLAGNVEVKDGTMARINPNTILGSIIVDPLTRKEFPEIKEVVVFDAGTTGRAHVAGTPRLIRQRTDKPAAMLPIPAGTYDVECKTADGTEFTLVKNVSVKARESKRITTDNEIAGFVVNDPKVSGLEMEAIYALRAGTNEIAAQGKRFGDPILVYAGEAYDIALKQSGGVARIKNNVTPKRGALTEVP
ncbi:MAG: hypothetical protein DME61_04645 [Verrucomicrobia bacterium]|nr:MAG: hypothetical protein DME61_04645 [Verrucomicrobiota bacterium]